MYQTMNKSVNALLCDFKIISNGLPMSIERKYATLVQTGNLLSKHTNEDKVTLVLATSGIGKTALGLGLAHGVNENRLIIVSEEISSVQLARRQIMINHPHLDTLYGKELEQEIVANKDVYQASIKDGFYAGYETHTVTLDALRQLLYKVATKDSLANEAENAQHVRRSVLVDNLKTIANGKLNEEFFVELRKLAEETGFHIVGCIPMERSKGNASVFNEPSKIQSLNMVDTVIKMEQSVANSSSINFEAHKCKAEM